MTAVEQPVRFRTDEYDRMTEVGLFGGRRIEVLEGTLHEMPPMPTPHLIALVRLQQMFGRLNAERRLLVQPPLRIPDFDEPEPDLSVLRDPLGRHKPSAADRLLVIEVSDSTLRSERERKLPAYRRGAGCRTERHAVNPARACCGGGVHGRTLISAPPRNR